MYVTTWSSIDDHYSKMTGTNWDKQLADWSFHLAQKPLADMAHTYIPLPFTALPV